jgi:hypothetical protein
VSAENSSMSCDLRIFVDQPAYSIDLHDAQVGCRSGRWDGSEWCGLPECTVWPVFVVVGHILSERPLQLPWADDQHPVEYWAKVMSDGPSIAAVGRDFGRFLPGVFWLNFFGRRYRALLGEQRLRSTPADAVMAVDDGVLVALAPKPWGWDTPEYAVAEQRVSNARRPAPAPLACWKNRWAALASRRRDTSTSMTWPDWSIPGGSGSGQPDLHLPVAHPGEVGPRRGGGRAV